MRRGLLALLAAGLMVIAGYALVLPLQESLQAGSGSSVTQDTVAPGGASGEATRQTTDRTVLLNISLSDAEPTVGSILHVKASLRNTGREEVLIEYFIGQLFEVVIRDEAGRPVYVHSDTGFQRYLMAAPVHLRLALGESFTETLEVKLVFSRGAERGSPLPPGTYTLTVYLTAAVEGQPSGVIDGIKAYASATTTITVRATSEYISKLGVGLRGHFHIHSE